jgi:hypothetical protein
MKSGAMVTTNPPTAVTKALIEKKKTRQSGKKDRQRNADHAGKLSGDAILFRGTRRSEQVCLLPKHRS